ncbi:hypothetical protein LCM20_03865 [Halobacillus litoralis]|uniref:hypothetical protein n=1 Tax=Halobacillus litoralis TaxID=45668 RepID=UPI001CD65092|nr:hypothetical protein [Halobacillus litoralis]MCA0969730.1 hypothetical protein [Halobacillus litoralis]
MKAIRIAFLGLIVVLAIVVFLFIDNRVYNQLVNDQRFPVEEELERRPGSITPDSQPVASTGIELSELYFWRYEVPAEEADEDLEEDQIQLADEGNLYLGFWYPKGNDLLASGKDEWQTEEGAVQFLVKAVDEEGTTYNGTTTGKVDGTFNAFQYVKIEDFSLIEVEEEEEPVERDLVLSFYPISESGDPVEEPLFEQSVTLLPY